MGFLLQSAYEIHIHQCDPIVFAGNKFANYHLRQNVNVHYRICRVLFFKISNDLEIKLLQRIAALFTESDDVHADKFPRVRVCRFGNVIVKSANESPV